MYLDIKRTVIVVFIPFLKILAMSIALSIRIHKKERRPSIP